MPGPDADFGPDRTGLALPAIHPHGSRTFAWPHPPYGEELAPECLYGIQILQGNRRIDAADLAVRVEGDRVWLSGPELQVVSTRVLVAQGDWYQVNLYNSAGLPARPAIADAVPKATP